MESNYRYYKTGGMHEWYKFELTKAGMNNESKEFENNKKLKVKNNRYFCKSNRN